MIKKRSKESIINRINKLVDNLKKSCHNKNCIRDSFSCPSNCCGESLGVNTAIIWAFANELDDFAYNLVDEDIPLKELIQIQDAMIRTIDFILDNHCDKFTSQQLKSLESAIKYVTNLINYIEQKELDGITDIEKLFKK